MPILIMNNKAITVFIQRACENEILPEIVMRFARTIIGMQGRLAQNHEIQFFQWRYAAHTSIDDEINHE